MSAMDGFSTGCSKADRRANPDARRPVAAAAAEVAGSSETGSCARVISVREPSHQPPPRAAMANKSEKTMPGICRAVVVGSFFGVPAFQGIDETLLVFRREVGGE